MAADSKSTLSPELTASTESRIEVLAPVAVERFDDYAIVGKLGVGGMAEVFLALSSGPSGFRKLLVVKRLHAHLGDDPNLVRMFLDEARLAARLNHPHVIQTHKVGSVGSRPFLAMEYLDGQACNRVLKRCADRGRAIPIAVSARIIADVLDGLEYAHGATDYDGSPLSVVHRDISPHNVFVGYDGSVKVLDFGIAKAATSESNTRTGTIKGKFAYIAPEQARGEHIDGRADVWSTGVSMWELLTGKRLFRRATDVAVLQATLSDPIPLANEIEPSVPAELAAICDRALKRDAEERWPSAGAMRDAIEEWLATRGREGSRSAVAMLMKELFANDIEDQRAQIRACVERVDSGTGDHATLSQIVAFPGRNEIDEADGEVSTRVARRGSGPRVSPIARVPATGAPPTTNDRGSRAWVLAGLGLLALVIIVGIVAWPRGDDRPAPPPPSTAIAVPSVPPPTQAEVPPSSVAIEAPVLAEPAPPEAVPIATVDAATAEEEAHRHGGHARAPRPATAPPTELPSTAPTPPVAPAEPAVAATGHLVLDATPYAIVTLQGRRLGITPIEVDLPAGVHVLTLRNPEQGLETTYRVTLRAGETVRRTVALE